MYLPKIITLLSLTRIACAWPGMGKLLTELKTRQENDTDEFDSKELIGDLLTLSDDQLTTVGRSVKQIITGIEVPQSDVGWDTPVPSLGTAECAADVCCVWQYIVHDLVAAFKGRSGRCTAAARAAIRLGFHDAAGFSKATGPYGGADGSLVLAPEEILRPDNNGLQDIILQTKAWYAKYQVYGITMADLVQFSAQVAVVVCPLGPRARTFIGRVDNSTACPDGLLPPVTGSGPLLIEIFRNKTIAPHGLTALIGAHTTSQQFFVNTSRAGDPQDSTPGIWDVRFYSEVLNGAPPRVFTFPSDVALSQAPETQAEFLEFANDGQEDWNEDYAREYIRLSLLSVPHINDMTECTKVLPPAIKNFTEPDRALVDRWRKSEEIYPTVAEAVANGSLVTADMFSIISDVEEAE